MQKILWSIACLLSLAIPPSGDSPKVLNSAKVNFPVEGRVAIEAIVKQGEHPHILFRSASDGKLLLNAIVGKTNDWKEFTNANEPNYIHEKLGLIVLHRPGLPEPLIVALAMDAGASDCRYNTALFGEVRGQLQELTPDLPDHLFRGGVELARNSASGESKLIVRSERYSTKDAHINGPSHMAVFTYKYDPVQGKFVEVGHSLVRAFAGPASGQNSVDLVPLFGEFSAC